MRFGSLLSFILHVAVVVFAFVGLPLFATDPEVLPQILPVELVTIADETNIKAQPEPEPEPVEEDEVQTVEEEPEPEEKVAALPPTPPAPEPEPEEIPKLAPEPEPEPKVEEPKKVEKPKPVVTARAKPRTKPKPPPEKKRFNADRIAALLDKHPKDEQELRPVAEQEQRAKPEVNQATQQVGLGTNMTLSEIDALRVQVEKCWSFPGGAANPEDLVVTIRISLNPDGSLSGAPAVLDNRFGLGGDQYYRVAAESALRAIRRCQPYQMPRDKYQNWRQIDLRFDPREMLGG